MSRRNTGKRLLSLAMALCLMLSLCVTASAAQFTDLSRSHWAYDEIMDVVDKDLFKGTGNNAFGPEVSMTRAMFVTVLARLAKADVDDSDRSDFSDVPRNTWYTGAVIWAAESGIVKGVSKDEFAPDRVITREEMATMIVRYTDFWEIELPKTEKAVTFDDWRKISDFADDAVEACQRAGLLNGVGNNLFDPKGTATRSQVAALISRVSELDGTVIYTVSFVTNGATKDVKDQNVPSGQKAEKPTGVRRNGYTLVNWYTEKSFKNVYDFKDPVERDLTLYAKWRKNSSGGSYVSYPKPEQPDAATLTAYLADQADFKNIPLTYPKMTMDGNTIVLEGAFSAVDPVPGFDGYPKGYVVPLKLNAPSNYSKGEIKLEVTGDKKGDVSKAVTLDGEYFIYVLKYVPANTTGWDPTLSVTWNGYKASYDFDVSGMKESVPASAAMAKAASPTEVGDLSGTDFDGIALTYADASATVTAGKDNAFMLHLSGGYVVGDKFPGFSDSKYNNGYVVPLRFTAPAGYDKAALNITGGMEVIDQSSVALTDGGFNLLMYIPASPGSDWDPVITVKWTRATPASLLESLFADGDTVTYTYTLNLDGMRAVRSADPISPDKAATRKATELDSNKDFKGIENFTAQAKFSAPAWNSDKTLGTVTVDVTHTPFLTGAVVPSFGTVGTTEDLNTDSFILALAFPTPDYLNLDVLKDEDAAMRYRYGSSAMTELFPKTKTEVNEENPFFFWLRVDQSAVEKMRTDGLKFDLYWAGGYEEHYLFKLGEVKSTQTQLTGKDMISGTNTIADATKTGPFAGLAAVAANVTLTKETEGVFTASATHVPLVEGQYVPGFDKAGTENVPVTSCVLPFAFPAPEGLDLSRIGGGDTALNLDYAKKTGDGEFGPAKAYTVTKDEIAAENPFHFYFLVKDPGAMSDVQLKFVLQWYGGLKQEFIVKFGELKAQTTNPEGDQFKLTAEEKAAITNGEGPFKGIQIDSVNVIAAAAGEKTVLKLSTEAVPQTAENIVKYYGAGYGSGYIAALKFQAPAGAVSVEQTILNGYTGAAQTKTVELGMDTAHTLLMYIPKEAPHGYAPEVKLVWKLGEGVDKTERFKLDLAGMKITVAPAPVPVTPPAEDPKSEAEKPQEEEKTPSIRDLFQNWRQG